MTNLSHAVREAAGSVIDPELRRSLAELGMIGAVSAENGVAQVEVRLTIAGCPAAQKIESDVRAAAASVSGVAEVVVDVQVMTAEQRAELLAHLRPGGPKQNPFGPGTLTRVIAVTSGKGGVGKSTLTANLAASLAHQGFRVGILDADVYGFSIPALMGLAPDGVAAKPTRLDDMIVPPVGHDVKVISIGMFVENANAAVAWRGPMLQRTITQFLTDVYFGDLDFLLLDLPPGTGDVAITVGQQLPNAEVLVVTTGQSAASEVAVRAGVVARQTGQRILGVVENMAIHICSQCGHSEHVFGQGGGEKMAADYALKYLGGLPLDIRIRQQADSGQPTVVADPDGDLARTYNQIALKVALGIADQARDMSLKFPTIVVQNT